MIRWIKCVLFHREWWYLGYSSQGNKGTCVKCGRTW